MDDSSTTICYERTKEYYFCIIFAIKGIREIGLYLNDGVGPKKGLF